MKHLNLRDKVVCLLIIIILFSFLSGFLIQKKAAFAQLAELKETADIAGLNTTDTDPAKIVGKIIEIVLSLLGLVAIILIIVGGFQWMTSGGNVEKVKKAKDLMTSAIIGLLIIVIAYAAATFIIEKLTVITTGVTSS